ncbi:MAG: ParB N-terminal domain-containing protein [Planctomycetota bacterium]
MDTTELHVEIVPLDRLFPSPSNPRKNDDAVEYVAASIRRFGFQQPIVAKASGEVIAGNTRWKAAKSLGLPTVPVVWFTGSDIDAVAFCIADNKTATFATFDDGALAQLLEQLRKEDALEGVGFTDDDIDRLIAELEDETADLSDDAANEPPRDPASRVGDLWLLGDHRLLCGDATSDDDVDAHSTDTRRSCPPRRNPSSARP